MAQLKAPSPVGFAADLSPLHLSLWGRGEEGAFLKGIIPC